jgi:hypothetical protein
MIRNSLPPVKDTLPPDAALPDKPGTRTPDRDLAADGLEYAARILRAHGHRAEADQLEDKARRVRWAVPA